MTAREKLVVVDDDPFLSLSLARLLRKSGFDVLTADGGQAAIDLIKKEAGAITLVLIDLHMPGMSGDDTATNLRNLAPQLKIIAMTGYSPSISPDDPKPSQSLAKLYDAFLFKPFENGALVKTIRDVLGRK